MEKKKITLINLSNQPYENAAFDLTSLGLISINGADAKKLLQGQLTCNIEKLTHPRLAAHCNSQGRIVSLFYIFVKNEIYYLLLPKSMIAITLAALKKYAIFYKAELQDASEQFTILGITGPFTHALAKNENVTIIDMERFRKILIGEREIITNMLAPFSPTISLKDENAWKCLDIYAKHPAIHPETSGKFLPHEMNLHNMHAIDFDKGCYTGQEIIARMQYRGKLKTHLYQAEIRETYSPLPGASIFSQNHTAGYIVDAAKKDQEHYCLLIVTDEQTAKNTNLSIHENSTNFIKILHGGEHDK